MLIRAISGYSFDLIFKTVLLKLFYLNLNFLVNLQLKSFPEFIIWDYNEVRIGRILNKLDKNSISVYFNLI